MGKRESGGKLVFEFVNGHTHVPGLLRARVEIAVVFGQQVHIMEHKALPVVEAAGLQEANVHQLAPVKSLAHNLFHNENAIVQLLLAQEGVQIVQENAEMFFAVPKELENCLGF